MRNLASIKYRLLSTFVVFLVVITLLNVGLTAYLIDRQSEIEAFARLSQQLTWFRSHLQDLYEAQRFTAVAAARDEKNLSDLETLYTQGIKFNRTPDVILDNTLRLNKVSSLNRLQLILLSARLASVAVYLDGKLSHYVTQDEAGMAVPSAGTQAIIGTREKRGSNVNLDRWQTWSENQLPALVTGSMPAVDRMTVLVEFPTTQMIALRVIVPIQGIVRESFNDTIAEDLTIATPETLRPSQAGSPAPKVIGLFVFSKVFDLSFLSEVAAQTSTLPSLFAPDGQTRLQLVDLGAAATLNPSHQLTIPVHQRIDVDGQGSYYQAFSTWQIEGDHMLIFGFALSREATIATIQRTVLGILGLAGLILIVGVALGYLLINLTVKPIKALTAAVSGIELGHERVAGDAENAKTLQMALAHYLETPLMPRSRDEVGTLTTVLNAMASHLHELIGSLETQVVERTKELSKANQQLQDEIIEREQAQQTLAKVRDELEQRVLERTAELATSNEQLLADIAKRRQVEEALQASEHRFRILVETMNEGLCVVDQNLILTYTNPRFNELIGYTAEEVIGRPMKVFLDSANQVLYDEQVVKRRRGEKSVYELVWTTKDGRPIATQVSGSPLFNEQHEFQGSFGVVTDITERKRAEEALRESETRYRDIFDNVLDGVYLLDVTKDGRFRTIAVNPALERTTGIPRLLSIGKTQEEIVPEEVARVVNEKYRRCVEAGQPIEEEVELDLPTGQRVYHSTLIPARDENGRIRRIIGISRDITEKRRITEALRESERQYRLLAENSTDMISRHTPEGVYLYVSPACRTLLGYEPDDLVGHSAYAFFHPEDVASVQQSHTAILDQPNVYTVQYRIRRKDGQYIWFETTSKTLRDSQTGAVSEIQAASRDVTERKRAEEALRESEQKLGKATQIAHVGYWDRDYVAESITLSEEACRIFGLPPQYRLPPLAEWHTQWSNLIHPEDRPRTTQAATDALAGGPPYNVDYRVIRPDGQVRYVHSYAEVVRDKIGKSLRMFGMMIDVTERKRVEDALRESERQYRLLAENSTDMISRHTPEGVYLYVSPACRTLLGYDPEDLIEYSAYEFIHQDDIAAIQQSHAAILEQPLVYTVQYRIRRKDGQYCWFETTSKTLRDSQTGAVLEIQAASRDITERKQAETALRESNERFETLFRYSPDAIFLMDFETLTVVDCNEVACQMNGYTREELVGQSINMLNVTPETNEESQQSKETLRRQNILRLQQKHRRKDGTIFTIDNSVCYLTIAGRELVMGIDRDVTDRQRAEEERQAYLRFLEGMEQVNRVMQGNNGLEQMMIDVLDTLLAIFNCDRAWMVFPCDPDSPTWRVPMERARPEYPGVLPIGVELPLDPVGAAVYRILRNASGPVQFGPHSAHPVPVEVAQGFNVQSFIAMALYPKTGQPWALGLHQCAYARVWTPQEESLFKEIGRRLVDALTSLLTLRDLQESERKLEEAQLIAHLGYWEQDLATNHIALSDESYRILGLEPQALSVNEQPLMALVHPEDWDTVSKTIEHTLESGTPYRLDHRIIRPDGTVRFVSTQAEVSRDISGKPTGLFGTIQDVTERRQTEEALRESEARQRALLTAIPDLMFRHDQTGKFLDCHAPNMNDLYMPPEQFLGKTLAEVLPANLAELSLYHIQRALRTRQQEIYEYAAPLGGEPKYFEARVVACAPDETLTIVRNITERKRAEAALRESEEKFSTAFRFSPTASSVSSAKDRVYLDVNDRFLELAGYTRSEVIGRTSIELNLWVNLEQAQEYRRILREQGYIHNYEYTYRRKNGEVGYGLVSATYITLSGEKCILSQTIDITARRQAEEARHRFNQRLSALHEIDQQILTARSSEAIATAVVEHLAQLIPCEFVSIVLYNDKITEARLFALKQAPDMAIHVGESQPVIQNQVLDQLKAGQSAVTVDLGAQEGSLAQMAQVLLTQGMHSAMANPMIAQGQLIGVLALSSVQVGFFTSEHQQIAEELANQVAIALHQAKLNDQIAHHNIELEQRVRERTAQLEVANRELEAFSYSVSHDLRAPLRAIEGFAEIIARRHRESLNEEGRRYFDNIVTAGEQMSQLITNLLAYARLGRQRALSVRRISLNALLSEVIENLAPQIGETHARIEIGNDLPTVQGDKTLLKQIFTNLVQNGLIYHQPEIPPVITISAALEADYAVIRVADNGIGISPEFHERIFNIFYRLHSQEEYPGTGIGLAIVRKSVEMLNGEVWLESEVMKGSTFYIKLFVEKEGKTDRDPTT